MKSPLKEGDLVWFEISEYLIRYFAEIQDLKYQNEFKVVDCISEDEYRRKALASINQEEEKSYFPLLFISYLMVSETLPKHRNFMKLKKNIFYKRTFCKTGNSLFLMDKQLVIINTWKLQHLLFKNLK